MISSTLKTALTGVMLAVVGIIGITAAFRAADDSSSPVAITGCLRQGSSEDVFVLRGGTGEDTPRDYLLVAVPSGVDLPASLNRRVAVDGVVSAAADGPPPPQGANAVERALRRIAVRSISDVAESCG
jgi:hypothetical protein